MLCVGLLVFVFAGVLWLVGGTCWGFGVGIRRVFTVWFAWFAWFRLIYYLMFFGFWLLRVECLL